VYAPQRHRAILEQVISFGHASVQVLAESLDVTPETIRRDLTELHQQGLLRRVHGGAMPLTRLGFEPSVVSRSKLMLEEKERIATAALDEIPEEGAIIVDAGTTTSRLITLIPDTYKLTIITNSVLHAGLLAEKKNVTVIMLGGRVRGNTMACVDQTALDGLEGLFADVVLVGSNGISAERGLTTPDQSEAKVKNAMLKSARRKVVLVDHTKFGQDHFASFGDVADIDVVITDSEISEKNAKDIEDLGPMVIRA
jgi:DeoR family transcriptional regulator, fructose operon transcriptional repressor